MIRKARKKILALAAAAALVAILGANQSALAEPYIGEIRAFGFNYCPAGWLPADGRLLNVVDTNELLFYLIGAFYGGDGETTFQLPDLRGRVVVGDGQGIGSSFSRYIGCNGGYERVPLMVANLPSHSHTATLKAQSAAGNAAAPAADTVLALDSGGGKVYSTSAPNVSMSTEAITVSSTGDGLPHFNMQPYLVLKYCIAVDGRFPSRY